MSIQVTHGTVPLAARARPCPVSSKWVSESYRMTLYARIVDCEYSDPGVTTQYRTTQESAFLEWSRLARRTSSLRTASGMAACIFSWRVVNVRAAPDPRPAHNLLNRLAYTLGCSPAGVLRLVPTLITFPCSAPAPDTLTAAPTATDVQTPVAPSHGMRAWPARALCPRLRPECPILCLTAARPMLKVAELPDAAPCLPSRAP